MKYRKVTALDEDVYTAALSDIIERDFFPDLQQLQVEGAFLHALETGDAATMNAARERLLALNSEQAVSPVIMENAEKGHVSTPKPPDSNVVNTDVRLNSFVAKYTSEDNASFTDILATVNAERRARVQWMFEGEQQAKALLPPPSPPKLLTDKREEAIQHPTSTENALAVRNGDRQITCESNSNHTPDQIKVCQVALQALLPNTDSRPALIPMWPFKAQNALMFPPPEDETTGPRRRPDTSNPRATTNYTGTRIAGDTPLARFSRNIASSANQSASSIVQADSDQKDYSLVSMTPKPHIDLPPPEMTWGELEATPLPLTDRHDANGQSGNGNDWTSVSQSRLHGSITASPYRVPEQPRREALSDRLSKRRPFVRNSSATSNWSARTLADGVTPRTPTGIVVAPRSAAARSLLARAGGIDSQLRRSYRGSAARYAGGASTPSGRNLKTPNEWSTRQSTMTPFSFTPKTPSGLTPLGKRS